MALVSIFNGWLHVIFAVLAVGGGFFNLFILSPVLKDIDAQTAGKVSVPVVKKLLVLTWISLTGLFVTGFVRVLLDSSMSTAFSPTSDYGLVMNIKFSLAVIIVIIGIVLTRTFYKIPTLQSTDEKAALKRRVYNLSLTNNLLAMSVIFLAVALRYGGAF